MIKKTFLIFLLLVSTHCLDAQLLFSSLGTSEGMSSRDATTACKDKDGFTWFGTSNGLNRYDGSGFRIYNRQHKNGRSLSNDYITCVTSPGKNIWLGTLSGLFILDKEADTIRPALTELRGEYIYRFQKDISNRTWVFTGKGIYILQNDSLYALDKVYPKAATIHNKVFYTSLADTIRKGMWVSGNNGLNFYQELAHTLYSEKNNPQKISLLEKKQVRIMAIDKPGRIWYVDTTGFVNIYDPVTNKCIGLAEAGYAYPALLDRQHNIVNLMADSEGKIWIGTWAGVLLMTAPGNKIIPASEQAISGYGLPDARLHDIYTDDQKNDWFLSLGGVHKLTANTYFDGVTQLQYQTPFKNPGDYSPINGIVRAGEKSWWICTENGLYHYDQVSKTQSILTDHPRSSKANRFFSIVFYQDEWWCATGDGIKIYNPVTKRFRNFTHYAKGYEIHNKSVTYVFPDKKGKLWFTVWSDAIYRYDPVTKTTERFDGSNPAQGDIGPLNCSSIQEDRNGDIWITSQLLRKFDMATGKWVKPYTSACNYLFETNSFVSFGAKEDKQGNKWIGVRGKGVYLLDQKGVVIDSLNAADGLRSDFVFEILLDPFERLWVSTSEAVHFVNLQNKQVSTLDFRAPAAFGDYWPVFCSDGSTLAVSFNDVTCFVNLEKLGRKKSGVKPLVTSIRVFEDEVIVDQAAPRLELSYNQNFFTIDYSSPDHREIPSIQYAYKLEGLNNDWIYCGKRQVASFSNLSNGHYRFLVRSTDFNGEWNEEITTVNIHISPPFWKRAWFILLLLLLAAALLWVFYQRSVKRKQRKGIDKTIDYFANAVYGENAIDEICWDITRNCIAQLGFEDCTVYLVDPVTKELLQKAAQGHKEPRTILSGDQDNGLITKVALTGKAEIVNDTSATSRKYAGKRLSEMVVPVLHEGKVIGLIDAGNERKHFFTAEQLKAVTTIASISANKIAEAQAQLLARENELKLMEINRMLAESKLMALRAQMNPHFVFNCLNSIQECIVTKKYAEASNYLNKFSKLFRLVLNNSGKHFVSIAEEREVLELYLQLELMRFENKFRYTILTDEKLDTEETLIPSMLLQPFVENALWHGLMHKEGERELWVTFSKLNEDIFSCVIEDNGIGREKAGAIKERQNRSRKHESMGLQITMDRIQVLQKQGHPARVQIIDKRDDDGHPAGTKVIIELPTDITY